MDDKKPRGAQSGNKNSQKSEEAATSFLHIRCTPADKSKWVKEAQGKGGLSEWVINILNKNS